jgi:hypothetical protein
VSTSKFLEKFKNDVFAAYNRRVDRDKTLQMSEIMRLVERLVEDVHLDGRAHGRAAAVEALGRDLKSLLARAHEVESQRGGCPDGSCWACLETRAKLSGGTVPGDA